MKILIIRHGEPDYKHDSLTKKGCKEAKLLAQKMDGFNVKAFYLSPLGRAQKTASYTLKRQKRTGETLDWLQEFRGSVKRADGSDTCCWDRLPCTFTQDEIYYSDRWHAGDLYRGTNVKAEYDKVCEGLDALLAKHGYIHEGRHFRVENSNHDTIVLFCHFGVESVLLSHLFGISPMVFWHNTVALTSSVTTLITEERQKGIAIFRMCGFSDIGHLYAGGEKPSFQARFCECFEDDTRHD